MKVLRPPVLVAVLLLFFGGWKAAYLINSWQQPLFHHPMVDAQVYDELGARIAEGDGYPLPVFASNPFYPYFLGAFYKVFGRSVLPVVIFQMLLGLGSIWLLYLIGSRIAGRPVGLIAMLIGGFYKPLLFFDTFLIPTSVGVFLNLLLIYQFLRLEKRPRAIPLFGAGLVLGLGTLVQGNLLLLLPVLLIWLFFRSGNRRSVGISIPLVLGVLLALSPATLRNWTRGGEFVLVSAHGGVNFYMGNNESATGVFSFPEGILLTPENINIHESRRLAEKAAGRKLTPSQISKYWFGRGWDWIRSHPADYALLTARKAFLFWNSYEIPDNADLYFYQERLPVLRWTPIMFGLVGPLGLFGLFYLGRRRGGIVLILFLASQFLSALLFYTHSRYRIPMAVGLIVPAALAVHSIALQFRRWSLPRKLWVVAGTALLFVLMNHQPVGFAGTQARAYSLTHLAGSLLEMGDSRGAEETYQEALNLSPGHASAHYGLGRLYQLEGRQEEAVGQYRAAVKSIPSFAEAYLNLGTAYHAMGEDEQGVVELREAIRLRPDWSTARYNLGNTLYDLGRFKEAADEYRKSVRIEQTNVRFAWNLSNALERQNKLSEAENAIREALVRCGEDADLRNRLGDLLEKQGAEENALAEYNNAVSLDPRHSSAICNIGLVQFHRGELRDAIATWRTILEYDPESPIISNIMMAEDALAEEEGP